MKHWFFRFVAESIVCHLNLYGSMYSKLIVTAIRYLMHKTTRSQMNVIYAVEMETRVRIAKEIQEEVSQQ